MILDHLSRAELYFGLGPRFQKAFEFLRSTDLLKLTLGKHEIEGDKVFALVQDYTPKSRMLGKFEAHERYWDVQFVARGAERMGWAARPRMTVSEAYDPAREVMFFASSPYSGIGDMFLVAEGFFTVFGPQDAHMPGVSIAENPECDSPFSSYLGGPANLSVRKVVVKVDPA
ncbi:YhcH/YjgK/YiaL family protein [Anatilimnocola floriformis]|uniref:YhcH/YjgK/YiaL family protein n=1 Tax=Anatilimnocola floriformis TaxID=2948575 RepID=UPI0020C4EA5A|nr:YhcH/YjgK/YiaL family protein [Anatilimnocola floriformis]